MSEEIESVLKKKLFLEAAIEGLASDRDKLAQQAAKEKDFQLLERSNDLTATIKKMREEIQECEKMEKELAALEQAEVTGGDAKKLGDKSHLYHVIEDEDVSEDENGENPAYEVIQERTRQSK